MKIDQVRKRGVDQDVRVKKTQLLIHYKALWSQFKWGFTGHNESWSFVRVSGHKSFNCITFRFASSSVCFPVVITSTIKL